jgi:cutinase
MRIGLIGLGYAATITLISGGLGDVTAVASAQPCPDAEVVFARGTGEPPGLGPTGQTFADELRSRMGARTLGVYAVNYPATDKWSTGVDGIRDASTHVTSTATQCPNTKIVLGGYSQGAAVMGFVTSAAVPDGVDTATVPKPLQTDVADHVAAVVLFGTPNTRAMNFLGEPPIAIGPQYQAKTLKLCAPQDAVCSDGLDFSVHTTDGYNGLVSQGVDFAANRLAGNLTANGPSRPAPGQTMPDDQWDHLPTPP